MGDYHNRRSRVLSRLAHLHPDEYADLMALERILEGLPPEPRLHADVQPCGTPAAYVRHRRRGEEPCDLCLAANTSKSRNYREKLLQESS